jgi:hypothetical protein
MTGFAAADTPQAFTKTDGRVQLLQMHKRSRETLRRLGNRAPLMVSDRGTINVTITFDHELSAEEIDTYEAMGVSFMRLKDGRVANYARFYPAWVTDEALASLDANDGVSYIDSGAPFEGFSTLDQSRSEIQADIMHSTPGAGNGLFNHGDGIRIANFDTGIDVHHPDFFTPLVGISYDWVDADGNGTFLPGIDCIDLNGNGSCSPDEALGRSDFPYVLSGQYNPRKDWLFNDTDGDGQRDYGPDQYDEQDTNYGEPIYVGHDANLNERLDVGEKLHPMGASKVRAALGPGQRTYRRGVDMIEMPIDPNGHGTSVSSILVAQAHGLNRKYVGIAPESELLVVDRVANMNQINSLVWALNEGADVVLWEFGGWVSVYLDGSSALEQAISQEMQNNTSLHVTPNGNLAASDRHAEMEVPGGSSRTIAFTCQGSVDPGTVFMSILGGDDVESLSIKVKTPSSTQFSGTLNFGMNSLGSHIAQYVKSQSPRGTVRNDLTMQGAGGASIVGGEVWEIEITNHDAVAHDLHLYIRDAATKWSGGVYWTTHATPNATLTRPATADYALRVGSYSVNNLGELSGFSGRGPRVDGTTGMLGVTAPGHHDITCASSSFGVLWGSGTVAFGGTSAAGPHVAGAAALLMAAVPDATPQQVAEAIKVGALKDSDTGPSYNEDWGHGKLRVFDAYVALMDSMCPPVTMGAVSPANGATNIDPEGLSASWDNDPSADRYHILYGLTNPPTRIIPNLTLGSASVLSFPLGTLEPNSTYYLQVIGHNTCGYVAPSAVQSFTTGGLDQPEIHLTEGDTAIPDPSIYTMPDTQPGFIVQQSFTIHNTGTQPLELIGSPNPVNVFSLADDITVTVQPDDVIAPNSSSDFVVRFQPSAFGSYSVQMEIPSNDADESPYTLVVEGASTAQPNMVLLHNYVDDDGGPASIPIAADGTFTYPDTGLSQASDLIFAIRNLGQGTLIMTGTPPVQITGLDAAAFSITLELNDVEVAGGGVPVYRMAFEPLAAGRHEALVSIPSNDPNHPSYTYTVVGYGYDPEALLDCNANGIDDLTDLTDGFETDCNANAVPDSCEADADGDAVPDDCDLCPDEDDATDADGDGVPDCLDNCPTVANPDQQDEDLNGTGNACEQGQLPETDCDEDGREDADQLSDGTAVDCDSDGQLDRCQSDTDGDGVIDPCDLCVGLNDASDQDGDGTRDCLDNCPVVANPGQTDDDGNGVGDACEDREDAGLVDCNGNGVDDGVETSTGQAEDCDDNGTPDECELDADGDGLIDACDRCPQIDDSSDSDGDGLPDCVDNCPDIVNPDQLDSNGDGIGDLCNEVGVAPNFCGAGSPPMLMLMLLGLTTTRLGRRRK